MAATDILSLNTSMGERAIRLLYALALLLITLGVVFGIWRGAMITSRAPMTNPPAAAANATPPAGNNMMQQTPQQGPQAMRPMMGPRSGFYRRGFDRRFMMMRRHPMRAGIFMILGSLLRGFIALMVVRILAEMGLAVLAMPRRA